MKVLSCAAIPIATVTITIATMHKDGREMILTDKEDRGTEKPFWAPVPKRVADMLNIGDTVTLVCKPVPGFSFATETFAAKQIMDEGRTARHLYTRYGYADYLNYFL